MKTNHIFLLVMFVEMIYNFNLKKKQIIPEEINYPLNLTYSFHSPYIINTDIFKDDLEKQRITLYQESMSHNGQLYYKRPQAYYGPSVTYNEIPKIKDIKFETPVVIENLEIFDDEESLRNELFETEMQLKNLLLFSEEPKYIKNYTVKDNFALPYYDSTHEDKVLRIMDLKHRILEIRKLLNIPDEIVEFYVEVRNNTFPKKSDDIIKHINDSHYEVSNYANHTEFFKNGNYSDVDDIYNLRENHLKENFEKKDKETTLTNIKKLFTESKRKENQVKNEVVKKVEIKTPIKPVNNPPTQNIQNHKKPEAKKETAPHDEETSDDEETDEDNINSLF